MWFVTPVTMATFPHLWIFQYEQHLHNEQLWRSNIRISFYLIVFLIVVFVLPNMLISLKKELTLTNSMEYLFLDSVFSDNKTVM